MSFRPELVQVQEPGLAPSAWRQQPWPQQARPPQPWLQQLHPPQPWPLHSMRSQPWPASVHPAGHCYPVSPASAPARTPYAFAKAFACAAVIYVAATGLLLLVLLAQLPSDATAWQLGHTTRRAFIAFPVACVVPGFITGVLAHWSSRAWPLWQVAVTFLPMFFLVAAIQLIAIAAR